MCKGTHVVIKYNIHLTTFTKNIKQIILLNTAHYALIIKYKLKTF